jgi:outer membrane biogenesis lipoprotein LolB
VRRKRAGRGPRRARVVVALTLALAGCATRGSLPPAAVPIPTDQAAELVRRWVAEWESFQGMRGAIELTVKNRQGREHVAGLVLMAPTALRLEVTTPFGVPALVATAGPDDITIFRVLDRQAQTARSSPAAVERWLGVALPPATLIRLLLGNVPPPADSRTVVVEDTPSPQHLAWTEDGVRHRVWVTAEGRPARVVLDPVDGGGSRLTADYEWSGPGGLVSVGLAAPDRGAEVTVRYLSAEYVENPAEAFRLVLPPDIPVQRLD